MKFLLFSAALDTAEVDAVCRMSVVPSNARSSSYSGRTFYVCSEDCQKPFHTQPTVYYAESKTRTRGADLEYMRKAWGKMPFRRICEHVGLNAATVRSQARKLGLPLLVEKWDREKVKAGIRRAQRKGRLLHSGAVRIHSPKLYKAARKHLDSWQRAVEQAEIAYASVRRRGPFQSWSRRGSCATIRSLLDGAPSIPYRVLERRHSRLYAAARNHFGKLAERGPGGEALSVTLQDR